MKEDKNWSKLYEYVKTEILGYDVAQAIPSSLVLRLKGLRTGKYMANNNIDDRAGYTDEVILLTFKICKAQIMAGTQGKSFKDETHKFNYICKIVENNLNDTYIHLQNAKKQDTENEHFDTEILNDRGSNYKQKTKPISNPRLKNLW